MGMKRKEILATITSLAGSQGAYGRLLRNIQELSPEDKESLWEMLEEQNFKDSVDFILYVEG